MEMLSLPPSKIINRLSRVRKDYQNLKALMSSITENGQLQPIVITREYELIAGGRRLAACIALGREILCIFRDQVSDLELRILELEENLVRANLTPAEEVASIAEIHKLQQQKSSDKNAGKLHSVRDTAKLIGASPATVMRAIDANRILEQFPLMKKAESVQDIIRYGQNKLKLATILVTNALREQNCTTTEHFSEVIEADSFEYIKTLPDNSVGCVITDPPYGLNIVQNSSNNLAKLDEHHLGVVFDDSSEMLERIGLELPEQLYRITTEDAYCLLFCSPSGFITLHKAFSLSNWIVYPRPIVWHKTNVGSFSNAPSVWPTINYELILVMRKPKARLNTEISNTIRDLISCDPVRSNKQHMSEKPIELLTLLINSFSHKYQVIFDPFAGSFSTVATAKALGRKAFGVDNNPICIAIGRNRISKSND